MWVCGTFPKLQGQTWLSPSSSPLFWECPHPWAFNPTLIPSADIHPFFLGEERVLWTHTLSYLSLSLSLAWRLNPLILLMWWVIRFTATIHFSLSFLIWASWPWWVRLWEEEDEEEEGALSPFVTGFCLPFPLVWGLFIVQNIPHFAECRFCLCRVKAKAERITRQKDLCRFFIC